ncbi:hypothetical protein [Methylobacterium dankookense]|uniref:Uncharacterized protein n=1 Tax=Methylobacterium dankookense TaxID=560405 RepID=A0A564G4F7_9HYPH|nr:hypothetical protein [Methylobacterium dankookense]GJD57610.1 hypothetical protein IFDJLNFL_3516 [Methylobacterium dankookense]VUF15369.1 hypothetical protein MTDSW087_05107 [Methylobacterium dankookense]
MHRPLPRLPLAIGFLLAAALPALAQGTPRSINDCERLKNDLAYNQCLSMFGPAARNVAGGYAAGELPTTPAVPANAQANLQAEALANTPLAIPQAEEPAVETRRGRRRYGRHGRQAAVFTVGSGESRGRRRRR